MSRHTCKAEIDSISVRGTDLPEQMYNLGTSHNVSLSTRNGNRRALTRKHWCQESWLALPHFTWNSTAPSRLKPVEASSTSETGQKFPQAPHWRRGGTCCQRGSTQFRRAYASQ